MSSGEAAAASSDPVRFDETTGQFVGLSAELKELLQCFSPEEQREHPQDVADFLNTFAKTQDTAATDKFMVVEEEEEFDSGPAATEVSKKEEECDSGPAATEVSKVLKEEEEFDSGPAATEVSKGQDEVDIGIGTKDKLLDKLLLTLSSEGDPSDKYDYDTAKKLGAGATGTVVQATTKGKSDAVAIKIISLNKPLKEKEMIITEIEVMKKLNHANIVNFLDCYVTEPGSEMWVVMEYLDGGPLSDIVMNFVMREDLIARVSKECLQAIDYLHRQRIIHRDIKSDNVLLGKDGTVKLIDFGFCAQLKNDKAKKNTVLGTLQSYGKKIDIWSFGIMVIEMLEGKPPYCGEFAYARPCRVYYKICTKGKPDIKEKDKLSRELQHFLDLCLVVDPKKRASASELVGHEFLEKAASADLLKSLIAKAQKA
ncbi:hypothetical protein BaRGS_00034961 [Batillaria attramentaria]|uniref:non-specific serine/threonine protein kinase n=1 Tax=Batillaria attramentaria TaxID=370345 RepID=A0ABD0JG15_9CAEN